MMTLYWEVEHMAYLQTRIFITTKKNVNVENYYLNQLNNEDDINPNTCNFGWQLPLPHKNISLLTGYIVHELYLEEGTYIAHKVDRIKRGTSK